MWNLPMMNIFPFLIIGMSLWASIFYAIAKHPVHAVYWFCAAALNICVTMMKEV